MVHSQGCNEEVAADALKKLHLALAAMHSYWLVRPGPTLPTPTRTPGASSTGAAHTGSQQQQQQQQQQQPFMGGDAVCVADLLCCCEIEQLVMLDKARHGLEMQEILEPYPGVRAWMARVAAACQPQYGEAHVVLRRAAAAGAPKQQQAAAKL